MVQSEAPATILMAAPAVVEEALNQSCNVELETVLLLFIAL